MGYTFKSMRIRNFKYITDKVPLEFEFDNKNIVILDGQNGYGKTTLFDGIEILLTGRIKHFNEDLQNRGKETIGILANDDNKDVIISAVLLSDTQAELRIERRLLHDRDFKSVILLNGREIQQEELYNKLKSSENMFDIGTYVSQSQSLEFLQNKYKDRKAYVSSLLDNSEIEGKIKTLKRIQEIIETKVSLETQEKDEKIKKNEEKMIFIKNQVDSISLNSELPGEDVRLFEEKEYPFDVIKIDENATYQTIISPLRQIEKFLQDYDEYIKYLDNVTVRELLKISKKTYMALFYAKEIVLLDTQDEFLKQLNKGKQLLSEFLEGKWSVDESLFEKVEIDKNIIARIKELLLNQQIEKTQLEDADKVLVQMKKARRSFIAQFNDTVAAGKMSRSKCPLCGTDIEDLDQAIAETEGFINKIHTDGVNKIENIEKEIVSIFTEKINPVLQKLLEKNKRLIQIKDSLSGCRALSTEKLETLLNKVGILKFESHKKEEFDIKEFSEEFEKIQKRIQEKEVPNKTDLDQEEIALYKTIHNTYYHNEKPKHMVNEIHSKMQFIAKLFNDKLSLQLSTERETVKTIKADYEKYIVKKNAMQDVLSVLVNKYEAANKDYQTQVANAIKLPLLIYSGRIIQNYPLGLGIKAVVKTSQLVFEAASKNGNDVYNILSTGQLNGLSIAFLLSIKNVYGITEGLDVLLIDDPLQTIDDISAISLADLLAQQGIGQIVLSTHEDSKAALLRYKFKKAGLSVLEKNMQKMYMEIVTK